MGAYDEYVLVIDNALQRLAGDCAAMFFLMFFLLFYLMKLIQV